MKTFRLLFAVLLLWCGIATNVYATETTNSIDITSCVSVAPSAYGGSTCSTEYAPAVATSDGRTAPMAEKYEETVNNVGVKLSQKISDLGNGTYTVVLCANALYTSGRGFESDLTDGATDVAYVFSNGVQTPVTAHIGTSVDTNGEYTIEAVEVTDGTLELGIATAKAGTNWHTLQIKSLVWHTTEEQSLEHFKSLLKSSIDGANADADVKNRLSEAIAAAQQVYDNSNNYVELIAANLTLKEAICALGWSLNDGHMRVWKDFYYDSEGAYPYPWWSKQSEITSVTIEEGVTEIGRMAFYSCDNLTEVTISNSVRSTGAESFVGCSNLARVTIGSGIKELSYASFQACKNLKEFTINALEAPTIGYDCFYNTPRIDVLNYPEGAKGYMRFAEYFINVRNYQYFFGWFFDETDSTAYAYVDEYAYEAEEIGSINGDWKVKKAYIDEGFTTIGDYAFWGSSVEEVYLPNSLTNIGDYAFDGCSNLKRISLPRSLETIGNGAFGDSPIEFVVIPQSVTSIGDEAFDGIWEWNGNTGSSIMPTIMVFKSFSAPYIGNMGNVSLCVPKGANSYPHVGYEFESQKEYILHSSKGWDGEKYTYDKLYAFGNTEALHWNSSALDELQDVTSVVFTHDATGYELLPKLPKVTQVDVYGGAKDDHFLYTINGSNAVFQYNGDDAETVLVAGCASTIIPEGTTRIGYDAFNGCVGLESIEIPNSVTSIGSGAFDYCTGLKSAVINCQETGSFNYCSNLETLTIGKDVKRINGSHFYGCTALANIIIDADNTIYDSRDNCNAIIETASNKYILASLNASIPSSVTSIASGAFDACVDFNMTIPTTVSSIEVNAFKALNRLYFDSESPAAIGGDIFGRGAVYVPASAYDTYCNADVWKDYKDRIVTTEMAEKEIEVWSTEGMSGILNEVGLNDADKVVKLKVKGEINSYDITVIRDKMPLLNELDLSEATVVPSSKPFYQTYCTGKNSLGGYAFYELDKLLSVKLPKGLEILGNYAFYGCDKLESVDASAAATLNIGTNAFENCIKLTEFVSPEQISEVGNYAFRKCSKLGNIELNDILGSIGEEAFGFCSGLKTIAVGSIGGNIQSKAFEMCSSLEDFKVNALSGSLNDMAFSYCESLKSVEFGKGPARIGSRVFAYSADNLERFVAGEGVKEVAARAFQAVNYVRKPSAFGGFLWEEVVVPRPSLKSVVLPQGLQSIGKEAFYQCTSLNDFTMPQSVTSIGESAFYECSSIESITIPNAITDISKNVFYGCNALKNVTFPDALTSIGESAFAECGFENLRLPPTVTTIGAGAFSGCSSLAELHIPSSMENIGSSAFANCGLLNSVYTYTVEPTEITETTFSTFASATLYVPATSFWNYYWNIGWSRFNHKNFQEFNEPYQYFYLNNDYYLNGETGYIQGTPDADLRPGSGLVVESDKDAENDDQTLGDVTVGSDGNGNSGSIIGDENLSIENLHVKINVKGGRWYFFAFPWDVPFEKISMQNGSDYVFRHYDGDERAKHGHGGWKDVNESHLKAARGYIFQCSADDVLLISIEDVKFKKEDKYNELVTHASENLNDASWNLMGNPYLSYYDMAAMDYSAPVTVWDGEKYVAVRPGDDDYQFAPYEAFFVQKPEGKDNVGFRGDDQMTKTQAATAMAQQAKARRTRAIDPNRLIVNLELSIDSISDRTRVVFNNNQSHNYETACDAAKFESAGVPQLYTIDNEGVHYAINERPVGNGVVLIGYTATDNGYYTIEASRMDTKVCLYDAETKIMHNLDEGSYTFFSGKGTFEGRFSLGVRNGEATGIENLDIDNAIEAVEGGILFNGNATATVYNAAGMLVAVQNGAGLVQLPAGTYVVSVGEQNKKVVVK